MINGMNKNKQINYYNKKYHIEKRGKKSMSSLHMTAEDWGLMPMATVEGDGGALSSFDFRFGSLNDWIFEHCLNIASNITLIKLWIMPDVA